MWDEAQKRYANEYGDDEHKPLFLPAMCVRETTAAAVCVLLPVS
jgi:hypothetical protein